MGVVNLGGSSDGLTVRDLGRTNIRFDVEFTLHTVDNDLKVEFSHTFDDGLSGFFVTRESEGRILGSKTNEGIRHLLLISLGLRFDSDLNDRLRELHLLKNDSVVLVTEGFSGGGILESDKSDDISSNSRLNFGTVVGVHLQHTSNSLVLLLDRVVDVSSGFHDTRVDTSEGKGTDERIVGNLESKSGHRFGIGRFTFGFFTILGNPSNGKHLKRRRHVINDGIQQRLDSLVLEGSSGQDRNDIQVQGSLTDETLEGFRAGHFSLEVFHEDIFILFDSNFDKLLVPFFGLGLECIVDQRNVVALGKRDDVETGSKILSTPDNGFHGDKVNDTQEIHFGTNRKLKDSRGGSEQLNDSVNAEVEVGSGSVHFVQEAHTRDLVLVSLTPDGFGLGFDSGNTIENGDGSIQNSKGTFDFQGEIDVTRGINDVDTVILPGASGSGGGNGNSTLLFLFHPIHGGSSFVDLTNLVRFSSVVKNSLGGGGLSGVDVGHDTDVTVKVQVNFTLRGGRSFLFVNILGLRRHGQSRSLGTKGSRSKSLGGDNYRQEGGSLEHT
mmetsp:Transcript_894/g.2071  ORF Transcript_894/g.2071 Transcript_894/m.2071 type:complete len:552 (+) Transcript_894:661-2316(+)